MAMIIPVIHAGGSGTRLWPLSTDGHPKQFPPLGSDKSMFAETLARVTALDTVNTGAHVKGITVATAALSDLIIVANKSCVVIMHKGHFQSIGPLKELTTKKATRAAPTAVWVNCGPTDSEAFVQSSAGRCLMPYRADARITCKSHLYTVISG